jgi:hypothetical protein
VHCVEIKMSCYDVAARIAVKKWLVITQERFRQYHSSVKESIVFDFVCTIQMCSYRHVIIFQLKLVGGRGLHWDR